MRSYETVDLATGRNAHPKHQSQVVIADVTFTMVPHHIDTIGARIFVTADTPAGQTLIRNYSPDDLRHFATLFKIAADEAESLSRAGRRRPT